MHLLKTWQRYCACHAKPLLTRHETCWNVTKRRACHAKTIWQFVLKPLTKMGSAASPIDTATAPKKPASRDATCWSIKTSISCEPALHFTLCSFKIDVFLRVFLRTDLKIDVSCEASGDFHDMSQNATPATQNDIGGVQSVVLATKNATHLLKTWQRYCACHTKPLLTRHETCWNVTKCHACHAKWSYATLETSKSESFCRTYHRHGHRVLTRTVADGCERLRDVWRTQLYPHTPRVITGILATHSGKKENVPNQQPHIYIYIQI